MSTTIPRMTKHPIREAFVLLAVWFTARISFAENNADWMARIHDDRSLATITVPGSHDSGATHNFLCFPGTAKCQISGIKAQLGAGVRFLDIRCKLKHGDLLIYHGCVNQCLPFDAVEHNCIDFLKAHPSECIIMSIKDEAGATTGFAEAVKRHIDDHEANWLTDTHIPKLGEARRRITLLRRFDGLDKGIDATRWDENSKFRIGSCPGGIWVQDKYIVFCNRHKWGAVEDFYGQASKANDGCLYLNFASGCNFALLYPRINATANYVNPKLADFFGSPRKGYYGVIIMDFVTPESCSHIVDTNF